MSQKTHKQDWEALGELDPLWAICSTPDTRYGKWDLEAFFATGAREIEAVMGHADRLGYPTRRDRALDFGCGVGRLTRALAGYFGHCDGVDIAESMIAKAKELNAAYPNCAFTVNTSDDLRLFQDRQFDMVYTNIVLQHIPSRAVIKSYIGEFVRILREGGLLVFQLPSGVTWRRRLEPRHRLYQALRLLRVNEQFLYRRLGLFPITMNYIAEREVVAQLTALGARVLEVQHEDRAGYPSSTYYVTR